MIPWLLIAIALVIIIIGVFAIYIKKKYKRPTDYYAIFFIGLVWIPLGVPLKNYALSIMGVVFLIVGLMHKDEWKKNRRDYSKLSKEERWMMIGLSLLLGVLLLVGVLVLYLVKKGILS